MIRRRRIPGSARLIRRVPALLLIAALVGCGGNNDRPAPSPPPSGSQANRRVISCAPNLTEMIFALGHGGDLVGVTRFCKFPPEATKIAPLGDLYQPNLEAMAAARPTLVVLVPGNRKVQEFFAGRSGTTILETNACETIAEIESTLVQLGGVLGAAGRAREINAGIDAGLDSVRAEFAGAPQIRYLMVLGHDEGALEQVYVTGGENNYLNELLRMVGGVNVVPAGMGRYPIVNREAIVGLNPEVVIERHLGGAATDDDRVKMLNLWRQMPTLEAVKSGRVVLLDDDHVTIPGPDLVRDARVLAALLHADGLANAAESGRAAPGGRTAPSRGGGR